MESPAVLVPARSAFEQAAQRVAALVRAQPDLRPLIAGSAWTVRQAAVHLIAGTALSADIATGMPSPVTSLAPPALALENAQRMADLPGEDPEVLAELLTGESARLLAATAARSDGVQVRWHGGRRLGLGDLVCISLGEHLLHGYDMAGALGVGWPIAAGDARLVLDGYGRVDEGEFRVPGPGRAGSDPVATLLAASGRSPRRRRARRRPPPP